MCIHMYIFVCVYMRMQLWEVYICTHIYITYRCPLRGPRSYHTAVVMSAPNALILAFKYYFH